MLVIVNPSADGGRARTYWDRIRQGVLHRIGPFDEYIAPDVRTVPARIRAALDRGERHFVAAGGDGTVNLVIGLLVDLAPPDAWSAIKCGAIGLGSSNDFHKPCQPESSIDGFPCRLDFTHAFHHDIGRTTYYDDAGEQHVSHWVINASVGTTATGNLFYNEARGLVGVAKRCSSFLGMVVAALRALLGSTGQFMTVERDDGHSTRTRVRNLGVVKNPHFTGCLRYDSPYEPDSSDFFVHLLADSRLWDTVITLVRLARGRFAGRRTARSWRGRWLALQAPRPFAVEGDGEIVVTRRAEFSLEPRTLLVCA